MEPGVSVLHSHGPIPRIGAYFFKFHEEQIIGHMIFRCSLIKPERNYLIFKVLKTGNWPISKEQLIIKHTKDFTKFTNKIKFDKL